MNDRRPPPRGRAEGLDSLFQRRAALAACRAEAREANRGGPGAPHTPQPWARRWRSGERFGAHLPALGAASAVGGRQGGAEGQP